MIGEMQKSQDELDHQADDIILQSTGGAAAIGAGNPIPLADAPLLISLWGTMLLRLAKCYGVAFDVDGFKAIMKQMPIS